jgi:hypothetical protein
LVYEYVVEGGFVSPELVQHTDDSFPKPLKFRSVFV